MSIDRSISCSDGEEESGHASRPSIAGVRLDTIGGLSAGVIGTQLSAVVWQRLLLEFPWIKTDAITQIAERCGAVIEDSIAEQSVASA